MIYGNDSPYLSAVIDGDRFRGEDDYIDIKCPVCGDGNCEYMYRRNGEIIGCTECIEKIDIWEVAENDI